MFRLLCVDDDLDKAQEAAEALTTWVKGNPYIEFEAETETSFGAAMRKLVNERFDLITLDLHGKDDPQPAVANKGPETAAGADAHDPAQQGMRVLEELRKTRFVPVIFYSGFAAKIQDLQSPVVRVVTKGGDDVVNLRQAANEIYSTGLPKLIRQIEEEQRSYIWDSIDSDWKQLGSHADPDELAYLVARRLAAGLTHEAIKVLLNHDRDQARPIEFYIYPAPENEIKTGAIYRDEKTGIFWIVATPACDFAQHNAENVLLIGTSELCATDSYKKWCENKWVPGAAKEKPGKDSYNNLCKLMNNRSKERFYFLPGTFFIPDLVVDMQHIRQESIEGLKVQEPVCQLDGPFREEFLLRLSKYYGRIGTPDLEVQAVFDRITGHRSA